MTEPDPTPSIVTGKAEIRGAIATLISSSEHPRAAAAVVLDCAMLAALPWLGPDLLRRMLREAAQRIGDIEAEAHAEWRRGLN